MALNLKPSNLASSVGVRGLPTKNHATATAAAADPPTGVRTRVIVDPDAELEIQTYNAKSEV
ncbi:hypothetical protein H0H92_010282 [Tricholoma furcatifolium]|nr:hypothetical protein H0H92_010282 [Tricholoma furcatifolium]